MHKKVCDKYIEWKVMKDINKHDEKMRGGERGK